MPTTMPSVSLQLFPKIVQPKALISRCEVGPGIQQAAQCDSLGIFQRQTYRRYYACFFWIEFDVAVGQLPVASKLALLFGELYLYPNVVEDLQF